MSEVTVQASTFKARILGLLDEVARSRTTVLITKHGKPVARLVPIDDEPAPTQGSVTLLVEDDELLFSTGERWDADQAPV
ncbi:MAG: type II toxin-antitoxin system prevent-host-death family antitoxin [Pseudonocardiaceae bacterium]|nr:type II toxin-antitoxin system prevent-host-death family antitoxin [Pseudonocardiaceae bacterium]